MTVAGEVFFVIFQFNSFGSSDQLVVNFFFSRKIAFLIFGNLKILLRTSKQPTRPKLESILDFPFRDEDFEVFGRKICERFGNLLICFDPDVLRRCKVIHTLQAGS